MNRYPGAVLARPGDQIKDHAVGYVVESIELDGGGAAGRCNDHVAGFRGCAVARRCRGEAAEVHVLAVEFASRAPLFAALMPKYTGVAARMARHSTCIEECCNGGEQSMMMVIFAHNTSIDCFLQEAHDNPSRYALHFSHFPPFPCVFSGPVGKLSGFLLARL